MPKRRMSEVVGQTRRVHDIRVGPQLLAELAAHLGDLEGVREAGAHEVVRDRAQHLRLFAEATQRRGVEDARAVALKLGALGGLVVLRHPALGIGGRVRAARVATINTGDCQGKLIHGAILLGKLSRETGPSLVTVKALKITEKLL
ncbi:Uncharacterised protein [Mycobacteroides abscessus subsp. abscessus]|nr:Uncharacterised protein [Mycobacteroides abscessus subsp. abscessus]